MENSWKMLEGELLCEDAKLKRVEEELKCVAYDIVYIPLKRKSEHLWTLRVRMIKEFNPRGICGGHFWTLRMRMRKILNPIFKYLNSFFGLNWLNEDEKDFEPNILIPLKEGIGIDLWFWPCSFCGRHLVDIGQRHRGAFVFALLSIINGSKAGWE